MASDRQFEEKPSVRPPTQAADKSASKDGRPLTLSDLQGRLDAQTVNQMQQTVGNGVVQRFLAQRRQAGEAAVDEETASAINRARGSGSPLDSQMSERAGQAMGRSFDDVTVHTGAEADQLSRSLGARAFTTGSDIFFREGAYEPGSSAGQELLAHELTHVAQQEGTTPGSEQQMTVNNPEDAYEAEADAVAASVMDARGALQAGAETAQRQEVPEEEEEMLQMQEEEEEELLA